MGGRGLQTYGGERKRTPVWKNRATAPSHAVSADCSVPPGCRATLLKMGMSHLGPREISQLNLPSFSGFLQGSIATKMSRRSGYIGPLRLIKRRNTRFGQLKAGGFKGFGVYHCG